MRYAKRIKSMTVDEQIRELDEFIAWCKSAPAGNKLIQSESKFIMKWAVNHRKFISKK